MFQLLFLSHASLIFWKSRGANNYNFQNLILGRFRGGLGNGNKRGGDKRKPENRVLKSTVGNFRNGILDVKHLLHSSAPRDGGDVTNHAVFNKGKKKKGGKKNKGKKKGGGGKRH